MHAIIETPVTIDGPGAITGVDFRSRVRVASPGACFTDCTFTGSIADTEE